MAKLRKGVSYRRLERPYTRKSKFQKKNFVRATPNNVIAKYNLGDWGAARKFGYRLQLKVTRGVQIRHNALESARKSSNRLLEKKAAKAYRFRVSVYPHHVLRENPLASGAGADRMSTGMQKSFGKPIGLAAQVRPGQTVFEVWVDEPHLVVAKQALKRCQNKLSSPCSIKVEKV